MNINKILNREHICEKIKQNLNDFENNKNNLTTYRGIYVYGNCGTGKTHFIQNVLKNLNYDILIYDSSHIRNKQFIENITKHKSSNINVLSMFQQKIQKLAIVMDEIDCMNTGDKGGITSLIKMIRPKKTKKQKVEDISNIPIICIGNNVIDKKLIELSKVCHTYELKEPTKQQNNLLCMQLFNDMNIVNKLQNNNIRQIFMFHRLYAKNKNIFNSNIIKQYLNHSVHYDNTKNTTKTLINKSTHFNDYSKAINETDRTTIALILHENIIDTINNVNGIHTYKKILETFCFSDYIDRITFQKQIWQLNELSCILKIFYNLFILHNSKDFVNTNSEIRFTKILTKYSTEYNNYTFIQDLCQKIDLDKKDVILFFKYLKYNENLKNELLLHPEYNITLLDINRIDKFLNINLDD